MSGEVDSDEEDGDEVNVVAEMRSFAFVGEYSRYVEFVLPEELRGWADHVERLEARVKELEAELDNRNAIERMNRHDTGRQL